MSTQSITLKHFPAESGSEVPGLCLSRDQLQMGIILDSFQVAGWIYYLLERLISSNDVKLSISVLNEEPSSKQEARHLPVLFRFWAALDRWVRRSRTRALALRDCRCLLKSNPAVPIQQIREASLDVVLTLSGGAPADDLVKRVYGGRVWELREQICSESAGYRFWEMLKYDLAIMYRLELMEQSISGTRILYRSSGVKTSLSLALNQDSAYWNLADSLVSRVSDCLQLQEGSVPSTSSEDLQESGVQALNNVRMAGFLGRWAMRVVRHEVRKRLFREQWLLATRPKAGLSKPRNMSERFKVLKPPADRFYADPFLMTCQGHNYLFFEDYRFDSRKGVISCCEVDSSGNCEEPRVVLEKNYHLSYPFLFKWQDEIYLIPESVANRAIELYRAENFPWSWTKAAVLMQGVAATDSTLLQHNKKWWLFTAGVLDHTSPNDSLFLFHAESPLGPWSAHPNNPVVRDSRSARPAGRLYVEDGQLIRPGQDCSNDYGYAVQLNRVNVLSQTEYQETPFARITPDWIAGSRGIHTFNESETLQVLDSKFMISRLNVRSILSNTARLIKTSFGVAVGATRPTT